MRPSAPLALSRVIPSLRRIGSAHCGAIDSLFPICRRVHNNTQRKKPMLQNESLRQRVNADLLDIQSHPALVRSFFQAPSIAYTTD